MLSRRRLVGHGGRVDVGGGALFGLQPLVVRASSMEPTLLAGDRLLANRLVAGTRIPGTALRFRGFGGPGRGEVWVLRGRGRNGSSMIKRVIGLPGDVIEMYGRQLYVNGERQGEQYANWDGTAIESRDPFDWHEHLAPGTNESSYSPTGATWGPLLVSDDSYFVMGDNRNASFDSRHWGMVDAHRMEARALLIYFSQGISPGHELSALVEVRWDRLGKWLR